MIKFGYKDDLKKAFNSNFLTKKLELKEYEDIHNREDVLVLRESKVDLLFLVRGERDVALINVNCIGGRIKMKLIKITKSMLYKATEFAKKGGVHES